MIGIVVFCHHCVFNMNLKFVTMHSYGILKLHKSLNWIETNIVTVWQLILGGTQLKLLPSKYNQLLIYDFSQSLNDTYSTYWPNLTNSPIWLFCWETLDKLVCLAWETSTRCMYVCSHFWILAVSFGLAEGPTSYILGQMTSQPMTICVKAVSPPAN